MKFLKSSPLCPKTLGCRTLDNLMAFLFAFLKCIKFHGPIVLDDDVMKDNVRLLLFRIMVGATLPSVYEQYGFKPKRGDEAEQVVKEIRSRPDCNSTMEDVKEKYRICDKLLQDEKIMKVLLEAYRGMTNSDFRSVDMRCKIE